eukprot:15465002-Alexandrium_andersonii.AAC.1
MAAVLGHRTRAMLWQLAACTGGARGHLCSQHQHTHEGGSSTSGHAPALLHLSPPAVCLPRAT